MAAEALRGFEAGRRLSGARLGRYQMGPRIGAGGSAAVYLGRLIGPMTFERLVAIKVVHEHLEEEKEFITQFLDEANLLVRLAHPNIVQVHELGREGSTLFLAMEYLHGQPLSKLVSALSRRGERLPAEAVAWLGERIAEGLAYAHDLKDERGNPLALVHRDVSPQNIFITYAGEVKLIDFGIARAAGRIAQTTLGRVKGKFSYMAPEQVLGKAFDHRADVFALGATLYEAAVGARLFGGVDESETLHKLLFEEVPDPTLRVPGFPDELGKILSRALQAEPSERYQTAGELAKDLAAYLRWSGVDDPQAVLAAAMERLFEAERGEQQRAIENLRVVSLEETTAPDLPERASGVVSRKAPAKPEPRLGVYMLGGFGVVVALGTAAIAFRSAPAPAPGPAPTAAPLSADVSVEVTTRPDVPSTVRVAGVLASGKPARVSVRRGDAPVDVVISAEGYEDARLTLVPDRDRGLVVPLTKLAPPVPSASSAEKPAKPASKGTPPVKKGDPLVTKYPFGKK